MRKYFTFKEKLSAMSKRKFLNIVDCKMKEINETDYELKSEDELENIVSMRIYNSIYYESKNDVFSFATVIISIVILIIPLFYATVTEYGKINAKTSVYSENKDIIESTIKELKEYMIKVDNQKDLKSSNLIKMKSVLSYIEDNKLFVFKGEEEFKEAYKRMISIEKDISQEKFKEEFSKTRKGFGQINLLNYEKNFLKESWEIFEFTGKIVVKLIILSTIIYFINIFSMNTSFSISKASSILIETEILKAEEALMKKRSSSSSRKNNVKNSFGVKKFKIIIKSKAKNKF